MVAKQVYMEDTFRAISEFYKDILLEQDDLGANSIRIYTRNLESLTKVCHILRTLETQVGRLTGVRVNFATRAGIWKKGLNILLRFDTVREAFKGIELAVSQGFRAQTVIPTRLRDTYGIAKCGTKTVKDPNDIPKTHNADSTEQVPSSGKAEISTDTETRTPATGAAKGARSESPGGYLHTLQRFRKPSPNPRAVSRTPSVFDAQSVAFEDDYEYRVVQNMLDQEHMSNSYDQRYYGDYQYEEPRYYDKYGRAEYREQYDGYDDRGYYPSYGRNDGYNYSGRDAYYPDRDQYTVNAPAPFHKRDPGYKGRSPASQNNQMQKGQEKPLSPPVDAQCA